MSLLFRFCNLLPIFAVLSMPVAYSGSVVAEDSPIIFQCSGLGMSYQLSFTAEGDGAEQKIQYLDGYNAEETHQVSEFAVSSTTLHYFKQGNRFEINRTDGEVRRNGDVVDVRCNESDVDLIAQAQAYLENATTTTEEFWTSTTGYSDGQYVQLGMLATAEEICTVLDHPFFSHTSDDYYEIDTMNSDFRWDGIEIGSLWINRTFEQKGVRINRFGIMENIYRGANANLSQCLANREQREPGFYQRFTRHFLQNLPDEPCFETQYQLERDVNDKGEIIERRLPIQGPGCVDFDYNSGYLGDWNTSTLTLMLIWREAHPVLSKLLDQGELVLTNRLEERERIAIAEAEAEAERRRQYELAQEEQEEKRRVAQLQWNEYNVRQKSLLEQVYNFATTGYLGGSAYEYWVEIDACVMSNGERTVDNRLLNMTAFIMYPELIGDTWYVISSDSNVYFRTAENIPLDRLQNAWGLAFEQCPGQTSAF